MVDRRQQERVLGYLRTGLEEGARRAAQASLPDDPRLAGGFFVPPAVLADVTQGMVVAQEEIFGPLACVMRYDTEDEAIAIANGTAYGLTCALITEDHFRASRLADRLEAGMVFVNNYMPRALLGTPFGGRKGRGVRRGQGQRLRARERRRDATRVRPREEHQVPLRQAAGAGLAAQGLTSS